MINPTVTKPWYRQGVLYQIYPLSFADTNGDGYGDLRGITEHLDYLVGHEESLGVAAIWLSPIYQSPMADWGYDVSDHLAIDPRFGTMADFEELLEAAHRRGLKVMLDFVPNHTSNQHAWFIESRSSRDNPKRDWYIWADPKADGSPPSNWLSRFGGSSWTLDEVTGQYYLHSFLAEQPDLNWSNPAVREAMLDVLRFWLAKGVDGFRTDAPMALMKDPELRDDPPNPDYREGTSDPATRFSRVHSELHDAVEPLLGAFCEVAATRRDGWLMSEARLDIPGLRELYRACDDHPVHAPLNFNLMHLDWKATRFRQFIDDYEASLEPNDWPNYVLGNHDEGRLASRVGPDKARLLAMLQLTLRGLPVIYYGDELGLRDLALAPAETRDEWSQPGFGQRDRARAPLSWNSEAGDGFTTGTPWLPVGDANPEHNVAREQQDPDSTLALYRQLIHLRAASPALRDGDYRSVDVGNDQVFAYARETSTSRVFVLLNFSSQPQSVKLGHIGHWVAGTSEVAGDGEAHTDGSIRLAPYEGRLYEDRRRTSR